MTPEPLTDYGQVMSPPRERLSVSSMARQDLRRLPQRSRPRAIQPRKSPLFVAKTALTCWSG